MSTQNQQDRNRAIVRFALLAIIPFLLTFCAGWSIGETNDIDVYECDTELETTRKDLAAAQAKIAAMETLLEKSEQWLDLVEEKKRKLEDDMPRAVTLGSNAIDEQWDRWRRDELNDILKDSIRAIEDWEGEQLGNADGFLRSFDEIVCGLLYAYGSRYKDWTAIKSTADVCEELGNTIDSRDDEIQKLQSNLAQEEGKRLALQREYTKCTEDLVGARSGEAPDIPNNTASKQAIEAALESIHDDVTLQLIGNPNKKKTTTIRSNLEKHYRAIQIAVAEIE